MDALIVILGLIIFLCIILIVILICHSGGYKVGQIDAMNGKIKYTLIEFEDGTRDYYKDDELISLKDKFTVIK